MYETSFLTAPPAPEKTVISEIYPTYVLKVRSRVGLSVKTNDREQGSSTSEADRLHFLGIQPYLFVSVFSVAFLLQGS